MTADEKRYLRCLCGGSKTAEQIADEVAGDPAVSKAHRGATVADRLAYLDRYGGTEHLFELLHTPQLYHQRAVQRNDWNG